MSMGMMLISVLTGKSAWSLPDLIATMWLGPSAADGSFGLAAVAGMMTHEATSILMGIIAVPFVAKVPRSRVLVISLAYALASYPLVFSFVMSWAAPLMYERTSMIEMTWGHHVYGTVFGTAYLWLTRTRDEALAVSTANCGRR